MDSTFWIMALGGAAAAIAVGALLLRRRADDTSPGPAARPRPASGASRVVDASPATSPNDLHRPGPASGAAATAASPVAGIAPFEPPSAVAVRQLRRAQELTAAEREQVLTTFREVPRPSRLLSRLVSMDLMNEASSTELVALISREPLIAAKVLAAVNSPLHGLSRPVSNLGQAVAYLGVNRVRAICLQYALMAAFQGDGPERTRRLEAVWNASALAAELTQYPMQATGAEDPGGLTSAVVLSFLGTVAVTVALPAAALARLPARDFLQRTTAEQALLGLPAGEIGRMLLTGWDLPETIVDGVAALDHVLTTPWQRSAGPLATRLGFGYLCARLGERLAAGELDTLQTFDLAAAPDAGEFACLQTYRTDPAFAALVAQLRSTHVTQRVAQMVEPLRGRSHRVPRAAPAQA
jgi:HD-like signal output (HDOD) protein